MSLDQGWLGTGTTEEMIAEKAQWMCARRNLHGKSLRFFEIAGSILRHATSEYLLITPVFFHSIIGLESALKLHYKTEKSKLRLHLTQAINDGIVHDSVFSNIQPLPISMVPKDIRGYPTHHQKLAELVPEWRNQFFHGDYLLAPDYFHLAIQMREIADVLQTKRLSR